MKSGASAPLFMVGWAFRSTEKRIHPTGVTTMSALPPPIAAFWQAYVASTAGVDESRFYEAFYFGDSEALADELAELVLTGTKRATASAFWTFEAQGKRAPVPGDLSVVTNWAGAPQCIIETLSVEPVPFHQVTAAFAATEGEGDGSLAYWREAHERFFQRECAQHGRAFTEDMLLACERFKVVFRPPVVRGRPG